MKTKEEPTVFESAVNKPKPGEPVGTTFTPLPEARDQSKPSFGETLEANFKSYNSTYRGLSWLFGKTKYQQMDDYELGYDPTKQTDLLDQVRPEHRGQVIGAENRHNAELVVNELKEEYSYEDTRQRSGWFANLATIGGATMLDLPSLIPFAATVRYSTLGKGFIANAINTGKSAAASSAIQNAVLSGTKRTEGIKEWVVDTLTDTLFAGALGGAVGAFAAGGAKLNLKGAKAYFKAAEENVDLKIKINEKGEPIGLTAVPKDSTVGAAQVESIQKLIDEGPSFKDNPYIKHLFAPMHPIIRGLTSPFKIIRDITPDMFSHVNNLAHGEIAAIREPGGENFVRDWRGKYELLNQHQVQQWHKHIGLKGPQKNIVGNINKYTNKYMPEAAFSEEVAKAVRRGGVSESKIPEVDAAAKAWIEELYDPMFRELQKRRPNIEAHEFTNIVHYLNRIYNRDKIIADPEGFLGAVEKFYSDGNQTITSYLDPINKLEERISSIKKQLSGKMEKRKRFNSEEELKQDLQVSENRLREAIQKIDDDIESGVIGLDLLDTKNVYSQETRMKVNHAQMNLDKIQEHYKSNTKDLKKLEKERIKIEDALKPIGYHEDLVAFLKDVMAGKKPLPEGFKAEELPKRLKDAEAGLKKASKGKDTQALKEELKQNTESLSDARERLKETEEREKKFWEKIDKDLTYTTKDGARKLIDISDKPKFRELIANPREVAERIKDKILQQTDEQLVAEVFDDVVPGGPNVLKERSLLWNDAQAEPWLNNDMNALAGVYQDHLAKRIHLDDVLQKYGSNSRDGVDGVIKLLTSEHKDMHEAILKEAPSLEREKKLKKLDKELKKATDFLKDAHKVYMGTYVDQSTKWARTVNSIKQFVASTLLGNVPILQLTEFFTPMFRFAFNEYINDGLVPAIKRASAVAKIRMAELGADGPEIIRGQFSDSSLANNRALSCRLEALFGYGTNYLPKSRVERHISNVSKLTSNINLTNQISDFQETAVAFASQAKTIRVLEKYLSGKKLHRTEIDRLDILTLNPEKYAKQIMEQFEKHGERVDGSYVANFHKWDADAFRAGQVFRIAMEKEVRMVITKPNLLDIPFSMRDPTFSLMTQFLSWPIAATLNFMVPALTSFDQQKLVGIMLMMASGSLVDPLRQLAKDEEVDLSFEALAQGAFTNSGFFGWQFDMLQKLNTLIDLPYVKEFRTDRFKGRGIESLAFGPSVGVANSILSIANATLNGEMNTKDAEKALRFAFPFLGSWYLRTPIHKMIESLGLPETRAKARRAKGVD